MAAVVWLLAAIATAAVFAQNAPSDGIELLQQHPYDLIVLRELAGGGEVRVELLPLPGRKLPESPRGRLTVSPLKRPGEEYEVAWADIERIELWEQMLLEQAQRHMEEGDFDAAFPYLGVLLRDHPETPGVSEMRTQFLFRDMGTSFREGNLPRTLALLEEIRRVAPDFNRDQVARGIATVTDRMLQQLLDAGRLVDAQQMLERLEKDYSPSEIASIPAWREKFSQMAEEKRAQSIAAYDRGDFRAARRLATEMISIWPRVEGGEELIARIDAAYPLIRVGVMQRATVLDPTRIDNWPARRAGRLTYRSLFEILGAGPEGGEYNFLFGSFHLTPDRQVLEFDLRTEALPEPLNTAGAFTVADLLTQRALPESPIYNQTWAGTVRTIEVPRINELVATLRRPHVLPQALLQVRVDESLFGGSPDGPTGMFRRDADSEPGVDRYLFVGDTSVEGQPREIVEVPMSSGKETVNALLRGEVDVVDQLFPSDAERLRSASEVRVVDYPLPTVHALVPWSDHAYLADRTFRRAILYAINRQQILDGELLGGQRIPGCRVVTGPFPAGITQDDPLGYAYDESIRPRDYQPRLAKLLIEMTKSQLKKLAGEGEQPPELKPIRIGHPASDIAEVACTAIKQQLELDGLGLEVELVELPVGVSLPERGSVDLLYTINAIWEPSVDARQLLGPNGLAASSDQLIGLGLRQLEAARNWREVRERLFELHRTAHSQLPVLPLWQLRDSFAYRKNIIGIGDGIVALYQNVEKWRLR